MSRTTRVSRYQNGKTSLDFTEARDSELLSGFLVSPHAADKCGRQVPVQQVPAVQQVDCPAVQSADDSPNIQTSLADVNRR